MTIPDWLAYFASFAWELQSRSDRVRSLIGDRHWLSDGHHKEYILIETLQRHLPIGVLASRGFVIDPATTHHCSREQDVLFVDTTHEAPLFNESGLVVTFPGNVLATVSVKSEMTKSSLVDTLDGHQSVCEIVSTQKANDRVWFGSFFFTISNAIENDHALPYSYMREWATDNGNKIAAPVSVCGGGDLSYRFRHNGQCGLPIGKGFISQGLATALFVSELLDHLVRTKTGEDSTFSLFLETAEGEWTDGIFAPIADE